VTVLMFLIAPWSFGYPRIWRMTIRTTWRFRASHGWVYGYVLDMGCHGRLEHRAFLCSDLWSIAHCCRCHHWEWCFAKSESKGLFRNREACHYDDIIRLQDQHDCQPCSLQSFSSEVHVLNPPGPPYHRYQNGRVSK